MEEMFSAKEFLGEEYDPLVKATIEKYANESLEALESITLELEDELEKHHHRSEEAFREAADALRQYAEHPRVLELDESLFTKVALSMRESTKNHAKTRLKIKIINRLRYDSIIKLTPKKEEL